MSPYLIKVAQGCGERHVHEQQTGSAMRRLEIARRTWKSAAGQREKHDRGLDPAIVPQMQRFAVGGATCEAKLKAHVEAKVGDGPAGMEAGSQEVSRM
jgi:hypothetical protein